MCFKRLHSCWNRYQFGKVIYIQTSTSIHINFSTVYSRALFLDKQRVFSLLLSVKIWGIYMFTLPKRRHWCWIENWVFTLAEMAKHVYRMQKNLKNRMCTNTEVGFCFLIAKRNVNFSTIIKLKVVWQSKSKFLFKDTEMIYFRQSLHTHDLTLSIQNSTNSLTGQTWVEHDTSLLAADWMSSCQCLHCISNCS